jgi:predicted RNA-binding Zn ribbon-like protein
MSLALCISGTLPYNSQQVVRVTPETIKLQGGSLSIDFANSVDWDADERELPDTDALLEPDSLDRWGARLGVAALPAGPAELGPARELRATVHHLFSALAREQEPDERWTGHLRATWAEAVAVAEFVQRDDGSFGLDWREGEPRRVRFAVTADAVALIADAARVARLHRCPGRNCGWVFLDTSGRRRWCSMATCGSREKMRRMYARKRAAR